ncbi:MAG: hypothetical protein J1F38_00630 [Muribaculaceae bacterium]|nr:hypothetical protein [Muribaculaceae bacterium]
MVVKDFYRLKLYSLFAAFLCVCVAKAQNDTTDHFFQKHIMVVVDQSPDAIHQYDDMESLFNGLSNFLKGEKLPASLDMNKSDLPTNFTFNPQRDEISLFAFGLGGYRQDGDWDNIHFNASYTDGYDGEKFFNDITNGLIHPRTSLHSSNKNLNDFINEDLRQLFNGNDELANNFMGVTMSHYVYPSILSFINSDGKAEEYYIIVVTNYKDGAGNNDGADEARIRELAGRRYATLPGDYAGRLNQLRRPFYTTNWLQMRNKRNPENYLNGMQLGVKSLQGVSVYISSNHDLSQQEFNRGQFTLKPVEISFNKNNTIRIDSIFLKVSDKEGKTIVKLPLTKDSEVAERWFDEDSRKFTIPSQNIPLGKAAFEDSDLNFQYQFFSTVSPEGDGKDVPYVFTAQTSLSTGDILFVNDSKRGWIVGLVLGVLAIITFFIMILRGKKRSLRSEARNFTTRFSVTTREEGTVELPCWFYTPGQPSGAIRVDGDVNPANVKFRFPGKTQVRVKVDILEKPNDLTILVNDKRDEIVEPGDEKAFLIYDEFVKNSTGDGKFKFTLNFRLPENVNWEYTKVRLRLRYETFTKIFGFFKKVEYFPINPEDAEEIDFFIRPEIGEGWLGIDPGTSGSCIAIGRGGTINQPNISLVEVDNDPIIPSKIIFDKASFRDIDSAQPGTDYTFGTNANKNWTARSRAGYQCFQSIKKLLGYQNGENNKLSINPGKAGNSKELSGMQLAHLLVKGILKDADNHLNSLPEPIKRSLEPEGEKIRRAVVAIPNNYTLPKTLDMVKSVAMTNRFDEVRPIFEAEAILCNYLAKTAGEIKGGTQNIAVYDMGGATINLTVFEVRFSSKGGSVYYNVKTLGRIGYAVGGDNIDFALMKYIFSLTSLDKDPAKAKEIQESRKVEILDLILSLKKNLIAFNTNYPRKATEMLSSYDAFDNFVKKVTGLNISDSRFRSKFYNSEGEDNSFSEKLVYQLTDNNREIRKYVKERILEVTKEILTYPEVAKIANLNYVIFSGRSVLFPEVKSWALTGLKTKFKNLIEWKGLTPTEVKTAVAYGACWYGNFNSLVTLENDGVASAYGFKLTEYGKTSMHVLIDQNQSFKEKQSIENKEKISSSFASDGGFVEFYQVMGSPHKVDLFEDSNRYKLNKIGDIRVNVDTEEILLEVKRSNQVNFSVLLNNGTIITRTDVNVADRDITDENDEAYIFATYTAKPAQSPQIKQ